MKFRAIVLAFASMGATLPNSAQAADDFCSRLIIQAVNQFCRQLPNGLNLCQPVALIGPGPECATPGRQALVPVPIGPATVQPLAPWAAPQVNLGLPTGPAPVFQPPVPSQAAPAVTSAASMATVPTPVVETAAVPPATPVDATPVIVAETVIPPLATPSVPLAPLAPTPPTAPKAPEILPAIVATTPAGPALVAVPTGVATEVATPGTPTPVASQIAPPLAPQPTTPAEAAALVDALAHFDFDSANLTDAGRAMLDAWLAEAPKDKPLRVSGHADRLGPEPYNLKLSLRRAEAVKRYLVEKGLNPRRIQIEAKGEAEPVKRCKGDNTPTTKACLAPNRRVVIDPE